jgi:hypothetical protein
MSSQPNKTIAEKIADVKSVVDDIRAHLLRAVRDGQRWDYRYRRTGDDFTGLELVVEVDPKVPAEEVTP